MTGVVLHYVFDNEPLKRHLAALGGANTRPLMQAFGEFMVERVLDHFETETAPDGKKWKPSQRALQTGGKTLQHKGHLRDSYNSYNVIDDHNVEVGSGMEYAAIMHFGTAGLPGGKTKAHDIVPSANSGKKALKTPYGIFRRVHHPGSKIDARPALGIGPEDEPELHRIATDFIMGLHA